MPIDCLAVLSISVAASNSAPTPIEKILFDGQVLTVQVIKDPIGTKGARLSTQISIAGRMLVYLPQDKHIGISQKIEKESEREALRARLAGLLPPDENGGYIVRTQAEDASDADLAADIDYLRKTWGAITKGARTLPATSLLYQDLSLAQRVLRDFVHDETAAILVDSRENYLKLVEFAQVYTPSVLSRLQHYTGERPLFDLYGVEDEILRAATELGVDLIVIGNREQHGLALLWRQTDDAVAQRAPCDVLEVRIRD